MRQKIIASVGTLLLCALASGQSIFAPFDAATMPLKATDVRFRHLLDADGDGDMDAVGWEKDCWNSSSSAANCGYRVQFWTNNGDGSVSPGFFEQITALNFPSPSMAAGRLGVDDGKDDVVFAYGTGIRLYESSPNGVVASGQTLGATVHAIATGWFNNDNAGDIVILSGGSLTAYRLNPFTMIVSLPITYTISARLFVADLDGDGDGDIGIADTGGLRVMWNTPNSIVSGPLYATASPSSITCGDIDGDGDEDVVAFTATAYVVMRNDGSGTLSMEPPATGGPATHLADVDGDGDLDGVCCSSGGGGGGGGTYPPPPPGVNDLYSEYQIALNVGGGQFGPSFRIPSIGAERLAGAADMDGDGDTDLVAGRCIWLNQGSMQDPRASTPVSAPVQRDLVDADQDGDRDYGWSPAAFQRNNGNGTWSTMPATILGTPVGGSYLGPGYIGDFDGDGKDDRVVEFFQNGTFVDLRLLKGRGGGVYENDGTVFIGGGIQASPYTALDGSGGLTVDADLDGDMDLVTHAVSGTPWTHVWLNDGAGHATLGSIVSGYAAEAIADLDLDGNPDMLASDDNTLFVLGGLGGGAFGTPLAVAEFVINVSFHGYRDDLVLRDVTGDGRPDLFAVRRGGFLVYYTRLVLLKKNATGMGFSLMFTIGPNEVFPDGTDPQGVAAHLADVDGDGDDDLLCGPTRSSQGRGWMIVENVGSGASAAPVMQVLNATAFVDVDGDGDADAIGPNELVKSLAIDSGSLHQFQDGQPGTQGIAPTLGAVGPFRVGFPLEARVTGAMGGALGLLVLGDAPATLNILGGTQYMNTTWSTLFTCGGTPGAVGEGSWTWNVGALPPTLAGVSFYLQVGVVDAQGPGGWARTNPIKVTIGL
ncbi:MAG: VCBS repeat-containing protein [Planctomycetes bacterium]|nr:VCBS repeat-containing protein [Planctomycetota bacterium]